MSVVMLGIAAALAAGAMAANAKAQRQIKKKRAGYMDAERTRQKKYQTDAFDTVDTGTDEFRKDKFDTDKKAKADELAGKFTDAQTPYLTSATQANTVAANSPLVVQEQENQLGQALDFTTQQGVAKSKLRSMGDVLFSKNTKLARNAGKITNLANFMQGSSNVLPLELVHANSAGDKMKQLGTMLQLASMVAGGAAGAGSFGAASGTQAATHAGMGAGTYTAAQAGQGAATGIMGTGFTWTPYAGTQGGWLGAAGNAVSQTPNYNKGPY